jgi:hypothetical protein
LEAHPRTDTSRLPKKRKMTSSVLDGVTNDEDDELSTVEDEAPTKATKPRADSASETPINSPPRKKAPTQHEQRLRVSKVQVTDSATSSTPLALQNYIQTAVPSAAPCPGDARSKPVSGALVCNVPRPSTLLTAASKCKEAESIRAKVPAVVANFTVSYSHSQVMTMVTEDPRNWLRRTSMRRER